MLNLSLAELAKIIPAILIGLTVHELSHSLVALLLGDDTPRRLGRITLNPIKHIDPFGFILLLIAGFGWAKPVLINRENLKNPRRDDTLIALAGPAANFLFAVLLVLLMKAALRFIPHAAVGTLDLVFSILITFLMINIALGVFNLLPIPPLDGSHLVSNLLSLKSYRISDHFYRYGSLALVVIVVLDRLTEIDLLPIGIIVEAIALAMLRFFSVL